MDEGPAEAGIGPQVHAEIARLGFAAIQGELIAYITNVAETRQLARNFHTWNIVEIAVRNPSVSEYMRHWEERATKAEQAVRLERDIIAAEARRYASHYPLGSDGWNTFTLLAEWIEERKMLFP